MTARHLPTNRKRLHSAEKKIHKMKPKPRRNIVFSNNMNLDYSKKQATIQLLELSLSKKRLRSTTTLGVFPLVTI
jgi:hypothetical protein